MHKFLITRKNGTELGVVEAKAGIDALRVASSEFELPVYILKARELKN